MECGRSFNDADLSDDNDDVSFLVLLSKSWCSMRWWRPAFRFHGWAGKSFGLGQFHSW